MAMTAGLLQTNGAVNTDGADFEVSEYEKIVRLRDEVLAGTHPRLKIAASTLNHVTTHLYDESRTPVSIGQLSNGVTHPPQAQSNSGLPSVSSVLPASKVGSTVPHIDPLFLTKSDVLVRAEAQQKRQRLERALEEQFRQKRLLAKTKCSDQEALADFDVTEVLRKAQELVKPLKPNENIGANGVASSSDSLDENTFYSSQMNDSTTEEAADESQEADGPQPMELDSNSADEHSRPRLNGPSQIPSTDTIRADEQLSQLDPSLQKPGDDDKEPGEVVEESSYSPPEALDSGREGRANGQRRGQRYANGRRRAPANIRNSSREYPRRRENPPSPKANDAPVIRNHITSPLAPQPARISPLAVAKVAQISQASSNYGDPSRGPGPEESSAGQSPRNVPQTLSSRKRRREPDPGDLNRKVAARRDLGSPNVRIKEEPVSPPLYRPIIQELDPRRGQDFHRPIYIDSDPTVHRQPQRVIYQRRDVDQPSRITVLEERRPLTPSFREPPPPLYHHYAAPEVSDTRRVVSARQTRPPQSPIGHYSTPRMLPGRAISQAQVAPLEPLPPQYRASIQTTGPTQYALDHRSSPLPRLTHQSPSRDESIVPAPPARRIVVDQYGNRFVEAQVPADRHSSHVPLSRREDIDPRYEHMVPRSGSVRGFQTVEGFSSGNHLAQPDSPLSPQYHDTYQSQLPPARGGQVVYIDAGHANRDEDFRVVEVPRSQPYDSRYIEEPRLRDAPLRLQSVRPVRMGHELPREATPRMQSVHPQQARIISLGSTHGTPQPARVAHVQNGEDLSRPRQYAVDRPQYRYISEAEPRGFIEDVADDSGLYELPRSEGRRVFQRY